MLQEESKRNIENQAHLNSRSDLNSPVIVAYLYLSLCLAKKGSYPKKKKRKFKKMMNWVF
jgi:hypothetical protein